MIDPPAEPRAIARRDLLIGGACFTGALLGGSTLLWGRRRALPEGGLAALVPKQIGGWRVVGTYGVVVAEEGTGPTGPYDDLLTRIYESQTLPPITLLIAYVASQRADVRLHRPEACYPAAGFSLSNHEVVRFRLAGTPMISAQMILAESAMRTEQLLYWTRVGNEFPTSNVAQIGAFFHGNLAGDMPDGVLVRLSVPGRDRARARAALRTFLDALRAQASPTTARLLFGDGA